MEWWGVYINGDRNKRYYSYISEKRARELSRVLNMRNIEKKGIHFLPMEQRLLFDEKYNGERMY